MRKIKNRYVRLFLWPVLVIMAAVGIVAYILGDR